MKKILITLFYTKRLVNFEFIPRGQTINRAYYVEILKRVREVACRKCLNFGRRIGFSAMTLLQHTSRSLTSKQFLDQKSITEMEHLHYSPDLAPNDF
jgi:hypothetical protein